MEDRTSSADAPSMSVDGRRLRREQGRLAVVDALLLENERHAITVHLQEQDPRGALITYLLSLQAPIDGASS